MCSLAKQWNTDIDPTGYVMSEKLDGVRAIWCGTSLWSRNMIRIPAPDWFISELPVNFALDGELFIDRKQFDKCSSIVRNTKDTDENWKLLQYVVFDAPDVQGGILQRLQEATKVLRSKHSHVHPHTICTGLSHLLAELKQVESLGGEGIMLRNSVALHKIGRTSDLLKVKSFHDDEALVVEHKFGKGKYKGQVGALVCVNRAGNRFSVGSGLTDELRESAPEVGSVITFKYFELTKKGAPRFPVFLRVSSEPWST
jgi:DNA ligase 1